MITSIVE